ncbi:MAG TPA: hypothetical protein VHY33_03840 [Thermoanaerobaculia bacterium]|jgi:hypothetical protein|nr:hypothetical protein [Thermoanaerobaculia bacterium]
MITFEQLKAELRRLKDDGKISGSPTPEERADWAYGTTKIDNEEITREMTIAAVRDRDGK